MRKSRIELLRIISMLMIVCLHYLSKGGALAMPTGELGINGYLAWLVEAFCLVAVNSYVLISGYFASPSSATVKKVGKIWKQVWFYSVGIGVVAFFLGQRYSIYELMNLVFPTVTEHYWFATYYVFLYLCIPILNRAIKAMNQQQLKGMLLFYLIL